MKDLPCFVNKKEPMDLEECNPWAGPTDLVWPTVHVVVVRRTEPMCMKPREHFRLPSKMPIITTGGMCVDLAFARVQGRTMYT